ncbi:glycerophosphoryl diester phosphodiesterase [Nocardiopsis sp. Huas11]|uniref:glycerophosphodiester phosphodiesterase n=1 Tax=Nocardiopsis sp. Huas11 TaxID=2183912 RepID=UPI000EB1EFE9|nr:glycerophosphodiester phosphodiesterase [Nocardiopsis sp. Huas11]RKS09020.1 glycerophosphoryl diester phosphodiesterase [Nocardiopsis sp. Huas11]
MTDAYLSSRPPLALAHRGGWFTDGRGVRRTELENTAVAFQHAVDLGYTYLETDVHATSDGVLMAFHDHTLDRATDMNGAIGDLPYRRVAQARVAGQEPVPVLEDLLGAWPQARFNIDLKSDAAVEPLLDVLRRTRAWERVCVGSFDQRRIDRARRLFDRPVATSCGPLDVVRLRLASLWRPLLPLAGRGPDCAQIPLSRGGFPVLSRDLIRTAHQRGLQVHVWTINEPAVMERLIDAGVDGIVTDNTLGLKQVLVRRGLWSGSSPGTDSTLQNG